MVYNGWDTKNKIVQLKLIEVVSQTRITIKNIPMLQAFHVLT